MPAHAPVPAMTIDSHAHLDRAHFDADRKEIIQRAHNAGLESIAAVVMAIPEWDSLAKTADSADGGKAKSVVGRVFRLT